MNIRMSKFFSKRRLHLCFTKQHHQSSMEEDDDLFYSSSADSDTCDDELPPHLPSVISSKRFFFSSPSRSSSIIDQHIIEGGVGVTKHSLDPYMDFRRSMQEMVHSRDTKDCEYLQQLLLCYLSLNHPHTHNYILAAFADLLLHLFSSDHHHHHASNHSSSGLLISSQHNNNNI
ncbi:hypothetical protein HN51_064968 [Arachis hypogaea]|nr:transcription repressor OFP12-like [Arachis ipaensis]QHO06020.1 Transcription repressor [Arachis hypogaea]